MVLVDEGARPVLVQVVGAEPSAVIDEVPLGNGQHGKHLRLPLVADVHHPDLLRHVLAGIINEFVHDDAELPLREHEDGMGRSTLFDRQIQTADVLRVRDVRYVQNDEARVPPGAVRASLVCVRSVKGHPLGRHARRHVFRGDVPALAPSLGFTRHLIPVAFLVLPHPGHTPAAYILRTGGVREVKDPQKLIEIALVASRQEGIAPVHEPHPVASAPDHREEGEEAQVRQAGDIVRLDPGLDRIPPPGLLAVRDQNVPRELELCMVGIGGSRDLIHQARLGGIGDVQDADPRTGEAHVAAQEVVALQHELHHVALVRPSEVAMAQKLKSFALGLPHFLPGLAPARSEHGAGRSRHRQSPLDRE